MKFFLKNRIPIYFILFIFLFFPFTQIQSETNLDGPSLIPKAEIFISPPASGFSVGSNFEIPIYLNTKGYNINAIDLEVRFDPSKMAVISPAGGNSILGIWIEPPSFDNEKGEVSAVGVIPDGMTTNFGLITTITFKALSSGTTKIYISENTNAHLNDGFGTDIKLTLGSAYLSFVFKKPIEVISPVKEIKESEDLDTFIPNQKIEVSEQSIEIQKMGKDFLFDSKLFHYAKKFKFQILFLIIIILLIGCFVYRINKEYLYKKRDKKQKFEDNMYGKMNEVNEAGVIYPSKNTQDFFTTEKIYYVKNNRIEIPKNENENTNNNKPIND